MKRVVLFALVLCFGFMLSACTDDYGAYDENIDETVDGVIDEPVDEGSYENSNDDSINDELDYESERCACGSFYADTVFRRSTPPLHIHEFPDDDFMEQFTSTHHFDFADWDTEWRSRLVVWTERTITELSFVSLTDHIWVFDILHYPTHAREAVFTLDVLTPGEAFVLDVSFMHYLIPRGMLTFTDYDGTRKSMLISESMAGGCMPTYHLGLFNDPFNIAPSQRVNSAEPTAAQQAAIAGVIGDFEMGEVVRTYYEEGGFAMYTRVLRGTIQPNADSNAFMTWGFWPPIEVESTVGDVVFIYFDGFDAVFALLNTGENAHGETLFQRIDLDLE